MGFTKDEIDRWLREAVRHFWNTRGSQTEKPGTATDARDAGDAVRGGAQMSGFAELLQRLLTMNGLQNSCIHVKRRVELPGWFRAEKKWDLLIVVEGCLIGCMEFKSHIAPSFGNNVNNRAEEALGNATDLWAAYREGAFKPSIRPWLGYLMLLEESKDTLRPVRTKVPHFKVFEEFQNASYAKRYEILLTKLVRERLYDASCLILSDRARATEGHYREPSEELSFYNLAVSLVAKAISTAQNPPQDCKEPKESASDAED
jgi:hypothetical protein